MIAHPDATAGPHRPRPFNLPALRRPVPPSRHSRPGDWRRSLVGLLGSLWWALAGLTHAAPVADSLDRPALTTRLGPASVLLGLAQVGTQTVAVGERGLVLISSDQARTWQQARVPVSVTLTAVRFADERHGFAVGHAGVVLSTEDGGQSWQRRLDGRQIAQAVLDEARADRTGNPQALAQAERLVQEGADKPLLDLALLSPRRVLAVGAYGLAIVSEDAGQRWTSWSARLDNPKGLHLNAVRQHGPAILVVGEQGLLLYSGDDGAHFQRLASPYAGSFFTAEMLSPTEFVVAGLRGQIWHTRDAGQHWQAVANPVPATITGSGRGADGRLGWVNQAGQLLQLRDGALQPLNSQALPPLSAVLSLADGQWLTAGLQGLRRLGADGVPAAAATPKASAAVAAHRVEGRP